jgi:hypothetical protein
VPKPNRPSSGSSDPVCGSELPFELEAGALWLAEVEAAGAFWSVALGAAAGAALFWSVAAPFWSVDALFCAVICGGLAEVPVVLSAFGAGVGVAFGEASGAGAGEVLGAALEFASGVVLASGVVPVVEVLFEGELTAPFMLLLLPVDSAAPLD